MEAPRLAVAVSCLLFCLLLARSRGFIPPPLISHFSSDSFPHLSLAGSFALISSHIFLSLPSSLFYLSHSLSPWRAAIFKPPLMRFCGSMDSYFSYFGKRISQESKVTNLQRVSNFERLTCCSFSSFSLLFHFSPL